MIKGKRKTKNKILQRLVLNLFCLSTQRTLQCYFFPFSSLQLGDEVQAIPTPRMTVLSWTGRAVELCLNSTVFGQTPARRDSKTKWLSLWTLDIDCLEADCVLLALGKLP